jgi:hypothetical protein
MGLRCAIAATTGLEDDAVYEIEPTDHVFVIRKRVIQSSDQQEVCLAPIDEGECEPCLDREALNNGELVSEGSDWHSPHFAYGWAIRSKLEKQVRCAMTACSEAASEVRRVRMAIENGEVVLTPERLDDLEFFRSLNEAAEEVSEVESVVNWTREGF